MKQFNTLFILMLLALGSVQAQERYLDEIFTDVTVTQDIEYAQNITVLTVADPEVGEPTLETLVFDLYQPTGDTETNRPVMLVLHTGNFLPIGTNGSPVGDPGDFTPVQVATRLALRGYVAVIPSYRKGWNPVGDIDERIGTLINASYRGIQDTRACVRFLRKSVEEENNPYGICPTKIGMWGIGTGGYISMGAATLDAYEDVVLEKFIGPDLDGDGIPDPYVIPSLNGDPDGLQEAVLNIPNTPGYDSDIQLCVNMGGALGDLSWIDESDPPMIGFHTPGDPFAPYQTDILIVPTTGDLIVEVSGSYDALVEANAEGLNDVFAGVSGDVFTDAAIATAANPNNPTVEAAPNGVNGLMPFNRPYWTNPFSGQPAPESDPWNTWDVAFWSAVPHPSCPEGAPIDQCNFNVINSINNQDHSVEKASMYLDSIFGYFSPRAVLALGLDGEAVCLSSVEDLVDAQEINFQAVPNPATTEMVLSVNADQTMETVTLYDLSGRVIAEYNDVNASTFRLNRNGIANGLYLAKVRVEGGVATQKVLFN